jgi:hypothetical protein
MLSRHYRKLGKGIMSFNSDTIDVYLSNIDSNGKRIATWVWLADKYGVSKVALSRVSSIKKRCNEEQFNTFLSCMKGEDTVLLSNGTSSHNIDHIAVLLREGHSIVGTGKVATTTNTRVDRSCAYLLHSNGYYKVGVTLDTSIGRRIQQLQIGNPCKIDLVAKTGTISNAYELEKALHKKFKGNKVRGEWFTLSEEELEYTIAVINQEITV